MHIYYLCSLKRLQQHGALRMVRSSSELIRSTTFEGSSSRFAHITVDEKSMRASQAVSPLCLPGGMDAMTLIRTGAVYRASFGRDPKDAERLLHDVPVYHGEYLRVHLSPRRYDVESVPWEKLVVHHEDDFIVLNKPPGVPTVPTGDNYYENVIGTMQKLLMREDLHPTQRLDTDTTGLLVIGKSPEFAAHFGSLLRLGGVKKTYKALVAAASISAEIIAPGASLVHYTPRDSTIRPRVFTADPSQYAESKLCEMTVLTKKFIGHGNMDYWLDRLGIPPEGLKQDGGRKRKLHRALERYFNVTGEHNDVNRRRELSFAELELDLTTGRTHQIRGQLSAIGSDIGGGLLHVAGDNVYTGMSSWEHRDKYKSSPYLALQVSFKLSTMNIVFLLIFCVFLSNSLVPLVSDIEVDYSTFHCLTHGGIRCLN